MRAAPLGFSLLFAALPVAALPVAALPVAALVAGLAVAGLAVAGCDGGVSRRAVGDAGDPAIDAATDPMDAAIDDASSLDDAFVVPGTDAWSVPGMDAWSAPVDAGPDANWGTCVAGGVPGTCEPMSECISGGGTPVMGLCPGPADIQCCPHPRDGGMFSDASTSATPADVIARLGTCTRIGGDYAKDVGGTANIPVCQNGSVVWFTADFDVDCDGGRGAVCMADPDYMASTSAVDSSGNPLDASTLPFIVLPLGSTRWRYADFDIRAGQVALVLYRDRMVFGIFGDAGPSSIIGEGSYAMAQALGIPPSPSTGGVDSGVTYLVFTGPGGRVTRNEDHDEAVRIGQGLLDAFLAP